MTTAICRANNQLALDLYSQIGGRQDNVFFSPYSIETALAMAYEGARGKTADEMRAVLHLSQDSSMTRTAFDQLHQAFNKNAKNYDLSSANALWAQKDSPFLQEYFSIVERYYHGKIANLDFRNRSEESRITINSWVASKTHEKIKDLIPKGMVADETRLVLTNAVYFKGLWERPFDMRSTRTEDFRVSKDKTVKIPMMRQVDREPFNYGETGDLQVLEMPYAGGDLSAIVLLPKGDDIGLIERSITLEKLDQWKTMLRKTKVNVFIPKFTIASKYFMSETFKKMGMPTAFSGAADLGGTADFSGMTGKKDLFIGEVIHQTFVEVNEAGTEAAAATAIVMLRGSALQLSRPPEFRADHPFIFLIQDKITGVILFLGKVVEPS